jgi:hypothetical protein
MEEQGKSDFHREEIFSRVIRAGKRTYFFDVKTTKSGENYLTITESKRRFNNDEGKFFYEKHKLFLYKEDFDKFRNGLSDVMEFIETGKEPENVAMEENQVDKKHIDVEFEDLGKDEPEGSKD